MPLQPGEQLGPYEIVLQTGQGGMATVYKAYQPKLGRYVAIKVLHPTFLDDRDFRARFEREARIIASLDHPHIVPVYDFDEGAGQPYLVMKYLEGRTLKNLLSDGGLPLEETLRMMSAVADALTYAHRKGVLHRDVKPSNIIIDENGIPYLTDFGLARMAQSGESTMSADMMIGTPHYISPEQGRGEKQLDGRTDVYSLGIILYELVVGRVPYSADTPYAIVHHHIYSAPPRPREINPDVPAEVEAVLLRALAKQPEERYETPNALLAAFRAAVERAGLQTLRTDRMSSAPVQYEPSGQTRIEAPTPRIEQRGDKRVVVERRFDASQMDFGDLGRRIEQGVRQGVGYLSNLASQVQEQLEQNKKPLSEEEIIRRRIEKRDSEFRGFFIHLIFYLVFNLIFWALWANMPEISAILSQVTVDQDVVQVIREVQQIPWPLYPTLGWGIGIFIHAISYYSKYGPGARRRERYIQREIERERLRKGYVTIPDYAGQKSKRKRDRRQEDTAPAVRLTEDGELTESYVEQWNSDWREDDQQRRR